VLNGIKLYFTYYYLFFQKLLRKDEKLNMGKDLEKSATKI